MNRRFWNLRRFSVLSVTLLFVLASVPVGFAFDLQYDANGNLIQDNEYYYEYNSLNNLVRVRDSTPTGEIISEYSYDESGQRIKKTEYFENNSQKTTYYVNQYFVRGVDDSGAHDTIYYHHDSLVARKDPDGEMYFYHPNHLGSTDIVTDASGQVIEETKYLPFGTVLEGGDSRYLFTGQENDKETGLMYYNARYYSPFLRHFTQPDAVLQDIYDPQSLNRYSYARNNPVKYADDSGHVWHILGGAAIGALMGGVASAVGQYMEYGEITDLGAIGNAALIGAAAGAVGAATFGAGLYAYGGSLGGFMAAGAVSSFTAGVASQVVSNAINGESLTNGVLNTGDRAQDIMFGVATGALAKGVSSLLKGRIKTVPNIKVSPNPFYTKGVAPKKAYIYLTKKQAIAAQRTKMVARSAWHNKGRDISFDKYDSTRVVHDRLQISKLTSNNQPNIKTYRGEFPTSQFRKIHNTVRDGFLDPYNAFFPEYGGGLGSQVTVFGDIREVVLTPLKK